MKKLKRIGILGYGEIGKAIADFYQNPLIKDIIIKKCQNSYGLSQTEKFIDDIIKLY
jgi:lactate dehydrogenase-like 2-hydroxyacid dehydrogenase